MQWHEAVDIVTPHVVRITTPIGSGTGFLIAHSKNGNVCGIATAAHVIDHAHYWEQPIRIQRADSTEHVLLRDHERVIFVDEERDTAAILFKPDQLSFPEETLPLIAADQTMKVGAQLGWLGKHGVPRAVFSHFGKGPIEMGETALREALEKLASEKAPGCAVRAARDGADLIEKLGG